MNDVMLGLLPGNAGLMSLIIACCPELRVVTGGRAVREPGEGRALLARLRAAGLQVVVLDVLKTDDEKREKG
ncbi:MAG: hypothetical protein HY343_08875 [Lentisphaerae bacterium]|nr:hypothetical protein [Lentisphaerota bacterium]